MQWWCAATTAEWTWSWRAYPGVWLLVLAIAGVYRRRLGLLPAFGRSPRHSAAFAAGLLVLWASLDWPLGALGAGYLLSAHTVQYVLITLVAVPLLLLGVPESAWPEPAGGALGRFLQRVAHPAAGLLGYIGTMGLTHVPPVSDEMMASQAGSFGVDLLWLVGGFALWWPLLAPPALVRMSPPVRIGYLFAATIPPTVPAAFMVFADYPLYGLYELAPRVHDIPAAADQQTAGVLMKAAMDPILWIAMGVVFFRWSRVEEKAERLAEEQGT